MDMNRYLLIILLLPLAVFGENPLSKNIIKVLKKDIIAQAKWATTQKPVTITAGQCERSAGGLHDFYSEGDYWWQNPEDPNGPYIQRDGQTNPSRRGRF